MAPTTDENHFGTLVIGGGQAGLAMGYHLAQAGEDFAILNASDRVGDSWRRRWDSLRLFTPAKFDGLPGMPFPADADSLPSKEEMADYLERYVAHFQLPVRCGVRVERLEKAEQGYLVRTTTGVLTAERIVLATGTNPLPKMPALAAQLDPRIAQLHGSDYRNPDSVGPGTTLVVGSGTSGIEIALELAAGRRTLISGSAPPKIPDLLLRYFGGLFWWLITHVLTVRTPMGRKARVRVRSHGAPLIGLSVGQLDAAGVERVPRLARVRDGRPELEDGQVLDVDTIVWATGYRQDFSWIDFPVTDDSGWPAGDRGVSSLAKGLFFVGIPFQYGLTSGLVGGVGRDAAHVMAQLRAG